MDTRLDQNQAELAVCVLAIALQVLSDGHRLLDQVVQVLGNVRLQTDRLHDAQDLVAVHETHLGHTIRVTEDDAWKR